MASIPASARALLESGRLAHLVTTNRDGSPQLTAIWVDVEGDDLVAAHLRDHQKLKNIRRDPRVALSVESDRLNAGELAEYLVVYGGARVQEGGAPELLQRLAHRYIGPDMRFPPMPDPLPGYVLRITPRRFAGVGPWTQPDE